ncbi:homoserine kinase [Myceligenerans salitolerans]|uniref:Homoserine kinase n=1 Tax=Myceligenerans salitolerans TaxID=1230528 RepID=A0ABS3I576_9MICO|nr:homoserine kinase [Myceligenerans salitolerans]MBO0608166.1 homoserine kinase [Myceligenerans salitolerans]
MQLGADHVVVRVPATSANLGPGYDALGLALAVHDEVEVRLVAADEVVVDVEGEGAGEVPLGEEHLVVRALRRTLDLAGATPTGIHMTCRNVIPHGRGMGSSSAAVVAGIVAARALLADPRAIDAATVLRLATEFEGHPDNAAPAIAGGATVAWTGDDGPRAVDLEVDPAIEATVIVPEARLETSRARAALPDRVAHADAAFTVGRAALLVEALARRPELLLEATEDRLHQSYRGEVLGESSELLRSLRAEGIAATISGAGPSVLVLAAGRDVVRRDAVLAAVVDETAGWRVLRPGIDTAGARARRLSGHPDALSSVPATREKRA